MASLTVTVPTSWKTTLFGSLTALGAYLQTQPGIYATIGQILMVAGPILLGIFAKDSNVTGGTVASDPTPVITAQPNLGD